MEKARLLLWRRGTLQLVIHPQPLGHGDPLRVVPLVIQKPRIVGQDVQRDVVFLGQCLQFFVQGLDLPDAVPVQARSLEGADQRPLGGNILPDLLFAPVGHLQADAQPILQRVVAQDRVGAFVIAFFQALQRLFLPKGDAGLAAFFLQGTEQFAHIGLGLVQLLFQLQALPVDLPAPQKKLRVVRLLPAAGRELVVLRQQAVPLGGQAAHLRVLAVQRDVLQREYRHVVQYGLPVLKGHGAVQGGGAGQFHQHLQLDGVKMAVPGKIMADLPVKAAHKIQRALRRCFPLGGQVVKYFDARGAAGAEACQRHVKFLKGIDADLLPEQQVEILRAADLFVVFFLLAALDKRFAHILAKGQRKVQAAFYVAVVQDTDKIAQFFALMRKLYKGGCQKQMDALHGLTAPFLRGLGGVRPGIIPSL